MVAAGLFNIGSVVCSYPENLARVATAAEAAGFESLWTGEHVVLPDPYVALSPVAPEVRLLDPTVALTSRRCPHDPSQARHWHHHPATAEPLVLAKELASATWSPAAA
jgi:hypothetical protein